jgi:hypothetical protein
MAALIDPRWNRRMKGAASFPVELAARDDAAANPITLIESLFAVG